MEKQNQSEEMRARAKPTPEIVEGVNSKDQEAVRGKTQPWFTPKNGSVIPPTRRLVKTMMLDYTVQSIGSVLCNPGSSSSGAPKALSKKPGSCPEVDPPPNSSHGKKENTIFPYPS